MSIWRATAWGSLAGVACGAGAVLLSYPCGIVLTKGPISYLPLYPVVGALIGIAVWAFPGLVLTGQ